MILVDVSVTKTVDKLTSTETANLGKHAGKQRVACNVEGDSEAHVTGALVHLA